jgi:hypothetical protein
MFQPEAQASFLPFLVAGSSPISRAFVTYTPAILIETPKARATACVGLPFKLSL